MLDADPNGAGANSATQVRGAGALVPLRAVQQPPLPACLCLLLCLPQAYAAALARGGVSVSVSNMTTSGGGGSGSAAGSSAASGKALSGGAVAGIVVAILAVVFAAAALNLVYQRTHARSVRDGVVTTKGLPEGGPFACDMPVVASTNPMRAAY